MTFDMTLDNCPFCGEDTIFEDGFVWNDKDRVRCGCQTVGCRGYYKECPYYSNFEYMALRWNRRPKNEKKRSV